MTPRGDNNWSEYRLLLLEFCEETKDRLDSLEKDAHEIKLELNTIKVRWAVISGIIGFLASLVPILLQFVLGKI